VAVVIAGCGLLTSVIGIVQFRRVGTTVFGAECHRVQAQGASLALTSNVAVVELHRRLDGRAGGLTRAAGMPVR
jgi:hypothetical protein